MLEEFATYKMETEKELESITQDRHNVESVFRVLEFSYNELSSELLNRELQVIVALTKKQLDPSIDLSKVVQIKRNRWENLFQVQFSYVKLKHLFKALKEELDEDIAQVKTEDFIGLKRQFVMERDKFEINEYAMKVLSKQMITCDSVIEFFLQLID